VEFVCLAAGRGTRMGRLGVYLQKCMYPVGLRPFLELSLLEVAAAGAGRVHIVVGHLGGQIEEYFGLEYGGMDLVYVHQEEPRGTGHAVALVAPHLPPGAGSVLVWQADVHLPRELVGALERHFGPNVLTLVEEPGAPAEVMVTAECGRVTRAWQGAGPYSDAGVWRLEPRLLPELARSAAPGGEYRALPNLQALIEAGRAAVGFVTVARRLHIGGTAPTPEANVADVVACLLGREADGR